MNLQLGIAANYVVEADQVYCQVFLEDTDTSVFHPELFKTATLSLYHANDILLSQVFFGLLNGCTDGSVKAYFPHPAHCRDLQIRIQASITGLADQDMTVEVINEPSMKSPLVLNPHPRIHQFGPRTEVDTSQAMTHQLDPEPFAILTPDDSISPVMLSLDFTNLDYKIVGTSDVIYSGGGNRLLPKLSDPTQYVLQPVDTLPTLSDAKLFIEQASTNLLLNSNFATLVGNAPTDFVLSCPTRVRTVSSLQTLVDSVANIFVLRMTGTGSSYQGQAQVKLQQSTFTAFDATQPTIVSIMARVGDISASTETKSLSLLVEFVNNLDVVVGHQLADYNPQALTSDTFSLLEVSIPANTAPAGTIALRLTVQTMSVDTSDDLTLYLALPQVEQSVLSSSRIPTTGTSLTRLADTLTIQQQGNVNDPAGNVMITFAPGYDGVPASDVYLFDTRDSSGNNGFVAKHLATGYVEFTVAGASGPISTITTSDICSFAFGTVHALSFGWDTNLVQVQVDGGTIEVSTTPYFPLTSLNSLVYIAADTNLTTRLNGELQSFETGRFALS